MYKVAVVEELNGSMLLSERKKKEFDKLFSFEPDFPYENFHNQGTFREVTEKPSPKLSVQAHTF